MEKVKYISHFYNNPKRNLDREFIYLSMSEMNEFVKRTTQLIKEKIDLIIPF